ncbi:MAG: FliM/FliN family flagellar motor switch protein [Candidatus Cybelea sp.]
MNKRIRKPVFGPRSALPPSAACVVANGVRETLTSILSSPVEMRVFEPSIPAAPAWPAIVKDAVLYRVRGSIADAAIVLRSADALSLVAALFGEGLPVDPRRELSPIERDVLDRTVNAIAAHLGSVCGNRESRCVERVGTIEGYATYFELLVEEPVAARIGVALSRDPSPEPRGCVEIGHLAAVPISARATLDLARVPSGTVAELRPGSILTLRPYDFERCSLHAHGRSLARGACGVRNGRYALYVEAVGAT